MQTDPADVLPVVFATALVGTSALVFGLLPLLRRRLMDVPNARSSHSTATPRGGGLAVAASILVAVTVAGAFGYTVRPIILVAALAFAVIGCIDDVRGLSVRLRLGFQFAAGAVVAVIVLGRVESSSAMAPLLLVTVTLWLVAYTNAFNFMDGINGISCMTAALSGAWYVFVALSEGLAFVALLGAAVAGAAFGFLPWNAPRARVFLGDAGSYSLGLMIASMAALTWAGGAPLVVALAPLLIYLADTAVTLARRIHARRPWHEAHREHVYQMLTHFQSHVVVSLVVTTFTAALCLLVFTVNPFSQSLAWAGALLVVAGYLALPRVASRVAAKSTSGTVAPELRR